MSNRDQQSRTAVDGDKLPQMKRTTLGLYVTAVNWHLAPDEAAYIVTDSGAQAVFASTGVAEMAREVVSKRGTGPTSII